MRNEDDTSTPAPAQADAVPDIGAAWIPRRKATLITYEKGAIELRDRPTGRLIAWYEPGLVIAEIPDLVALFSSPPDAWFAPRIHGILMEAEYAILRGRVTPRDMHKALGQMLGRPERAGEIFRANPVLARTLTLQAIHTGTPIDKRALVKARKAFKPGRGPRPKETREFFLEEVKQIAVEYGMNTQLPQHHDKREGGVTRFFSFTLAMVDILVARVMERCPDIDKDELRRRRLAPFTWSRVALLDKLEHLKRGRDAVPSVDESKSGQDRRARDRARAQQRRIAAGAKNRAAYEGESLTKVQPWAEGMSRAAWYRKTRQVRPRPNPKNH